MNEIVFSDEALKYISTVTKKERSQTNISQKISITAPRFNSFKPQIPLQFFMGDELTPFNLFQSFPDLSNLLINERFIIHLTLCTPFKFFNPDSNPLFIHSRSPNPHSHPHISPSSRQKRRDNP